MVSERTDESDKVLSGKRYLKKFYTKTADRNFSKTAVGYIQRARRLKGNDRERKALCRQAYADHTSGILSEKEYYYIECICRNIDEEKTALFIKDLKKHSKKQNIPVSPARDKWNTFIFVVMFGTVVVLGVLGFCLTSMANKGRYFQEGLSGLFIGAFLSRFVYFLCMLPVAVILYKKAEKNKILRAGLIFSVLIIVFFTFRNPVLDLWDLDDPKMIRLENVYMDVNRGGRNSYTLRGNDKNGKNYCFDINGKRFSEIDLLEENDRTVTVTYLPHTEIILDINYER